jgi:ABC-type molybdate transport system substrate-binding protein
MGITLDYTAMECSNILRKLMRYMAIVMALVNLFAWQAKAATQNEIESVTVLADTRLAISLSELAARFSQKTMISISGTFGASEEQKKKIEDGESADLFITSDMDLVQQLKVKGLVDVYSIGRIASHKDVHFTAAVVASENMTPARTFLTFLKSDEARGIFKKNGLTAP